MKGKLFLAAILGASLAPCVLMAQAPAGATGKCKDGTYTTAPTKKGACKGHKGIDTWMAGSSAKAAKTATSSATTPAAPAAATKTATAKTSTAAKAAAPGGGPGQVWVNTSSKVYHCSGDKYYGKTKSGKYMSESDAKAAGYKASGGKACSAN